MLEETAARPSAAVAIFSTSQARRYWNSPARQVNAPASKSLEERQIH
ncbi:MAG: hypothetical protein QOI49_1279 [Verrucomicrobiota bacterium]